MVRGVPAVRLPHHSRVRRAAVAAAGARRQVRQLDRRGAVPHCQGEARVGRGGGGRMADPGPGPLGESSVGCGVKTRP